MPHELDALRGRVDRLEAGVGEIRTTLRHCLQVADKPEDSMMLARRIIEGLSTRIVDALGEKPKGTLDANIRLLETDTVLSRGLVPQEIITLLHMIRVLGNKAAHDVLRIRPTAADVDLVMRSVLRVVEWYFAEFRRGPQINPLFSGPAALPPLEAEGLPPAVRLPALVVVGPGPEPRHRVFVFTERLLGFGREKPSRDPRVHVTTRLLPSPDPGHPNFALNLENISRFHAQIWWQMGRAEIRDEASDKGVFVNGNAVAPGVWTSCSFPDPALVSLGPGGVEFSIAEIVRQVGPAQLLCLKLARIGNWPRHEYLLISRPMFTIGAGADAVVWMERAPGVDATVAAGGRGWEVRVTNAEPCPIEPGADVPLGDGVVVRRASEVDFLS